MCRSMVDIQSATAEIRRGKKEEDGRFRIKLDTRGKFAHSRSYKRHVRITALLPVDNTNEHKRHAEKFSLLENAL